MHFKPKSLDCLRGYNRQHFVSDLSAGATVAVVALPLAMAFAMASGLKPEAGLFTAIIAGFLISALGGTRLQIGGPAGAFIVIVYGIVERYGVANLIIATALSGLMLFAMGLLKLGTLVRFIPVAVIIGFTNGIAVLIALSQVKDFLGLRIANMPAQFTGMLQALWQALPSLNLHALGLAAAVDFLAAAFFAGVFVAVFAVAFTAPLAGALGVALPAAVFRGGNLLGANSKLTFPASGSQASMALKARRVRMLTNLSSKSVFPVASNFSICSRAMGCCKIICPLLKSQLGVGCAKVGTVRSHT